MSPTLLSLAPELLCALAEYVTKKDLKRLRLTCKHLGDILESEVLNTIHFSIEHRNYSQATAKLQPLATTKNLSPPRGLSRSGRHFHIGPLSTKHLPRVSAGYQIPLDDPTILVAEELMRTYLCDALNALQSIQSVTWTPGGDDEAWTHETVMEFLASRPSLHVLEVELGHLKIAVMLDRMQHLQEISFTEDYHYRPAEPIRVQTYNNLTKLLASRPAGQIVQLSVVLTSLHEIFQFSNPEVGAVRLKDLRMQKSLIKLDALTVPHLRHLTCLHLLNMKIHSESWREYLKVTTPGSARAQKMELEDRKASKMLNDFWLALQRAGIHLKEIKVDSINDGLLGYLTCYTGLIKLGIESYFFPLPEYSDALARRFFTESLASHVETLEELDVEAGYEDLWCFGKHNVSAFSRCIGLKTLGVCVSNADLPARESRATARTAQKRSGIVKNLLDMVSTRMPLLTRLSISRANKVILSQRPGSGNRSFTPVIECLLAYRIPPSITIAQLPSVMINSWRFEPKFPTPLPDEAVGGERVRVGRYEEIEEEEEDVFTDVDSEE